MSMGGGQFCKETCGWQTMQKHPKKTNDVLTEFGGCVIIKLKNHLVKGE